MPRVELPDSEITQAARAALDAAAPPALVNHSLRTFLFGRAYARVRGIDFDEEGLYLAALFHDMGLTPEHLDRSRPFTRTSAALLANFLREHGITDARAERLGAAIVLHMLPLPRWSESAEAGLLQVGAWMDATGLRRFPLRREARAIEREVPRIGFDRAFPPLLLKSIGSVRTCLGLFLPRV